MDGAPGIGKSTLAWEVCHKWEELESVKQYELVVLVCLRDKRAQEACCPGDLLPCDATTNINDLLAIIGEGESLLFVCDGFNELPYEKQQKGSIYIDLIKGRVFPKATIIVTSHPSVSADLFSLCQHNIHRHLEIIGFTKENIQRYAESVFSGDVLTGFLSYITSNPFIYGMMYIPLHAVIVALIYKDSDTLFPKTMTELFDSLTCAIIRRHLVSTYQVDSRYLMPCSLQCKKNIYKLPSLIAKKFLQLAELAYNACFCEKVYYVFSDLDKDFEHLGIMNKTTSLNVYGARSSYSFLHVTLQEYFATLYIVVENLSSLKLVKLLEAGDSVVRFLAGMFKHDGYRSHPLYDEMLQTIASNPATISRDMLHCVYEYPKIMDNVRVDYSQRDTIRVLPKVRPDWYALGYCINHNPDVRWELAMDYYTMKEDGVNLLLKGLGSCHVQYVFIECLSLSQTQLEKFDQLHCENLRLHCVSINHDDENVLQKLMESGRLRRLEYTTGLEHTDTLIPLLFQQSSLQELILEVHSNLRTELLPKNNENIKKLVFTCNILHSLASLIPKITSLIYLEITDILSDESLLDLTKIVQLHLTLEVLKIASHKDRTDTSNTNLLLLIEAADNNRQLRELKIECSDYDKLPPPFKKDYLLKPY